MNGWIKLHRKILENEQLMSDANAFLMFTKLLLVADQKTGRFTTGRFRLADLCNMKPSTARDTLKRLKKYKMTTLVPDNKKTIITICNWGKYQDKTDTLTDIKPTSNRHPDDTKQEVIIKNKENDTNVSLAKPVYGKPELNELFEYWTGTVGFEITSKIVANRRALNNLLTKHGADKVHRLIDGVSISSTDRYAPRISDFVQLQDRLSDLLMWGKKQAVTKKKGIKL